MSNQVDLCREDARMKAPPFQRLMMNEPVPQPSLALYELVSPTYHSAVVSERDPQAARDRVAKADRAGHWQEASAQLLGHGGPKARIIALEQS